MYQRRRKMSAEKNKCVEGATENPRRPKASKRDHDCIKINVGGTIFTTARSTLASSSTYFRSRFSAHWNDDENEDGSGEDETIFIDQDPQVFAILLSFMRLGFIERKDLTKAVLAQAEFFGITLLLNAAKCIAYQNIHGVSLSNELTIDDVLAYFDKYGSTMGAIAAGVLPAKVQPVEGLLNKEYAHLIAFDCIIDIIPRDETLCPTLCMVVNAPARIIDPSSEEEFRRVPGCHTFLDALNWLHLNGFTTEEEGLERVDTDYHPYVHYWFSRTVETNSENEALQRLSNHILFEHENDDNHQHDRRKRKFAALVVFEESLQMNPYVLADIGIQTRVQFPAEGYVPVDLSGFEATSNIKRVSDIGVRPEEMLTWLNKNGYRNREAAMEKVYNKLDGNACVLSGGNNTSARVMLFSKSLHPHQQQDT